MPRNGGRLHFAPKQCNGRVIVFWDLRRKVRKALRSYEAESFQVLQRLRGKEKLSHVHTHACRYTHWILLCLPADRCPQLSTNSHAIIHHVYTNSIDLLYTHTPREGTTYLQLISSAFPPPSFSTQTSSTSISLAAVFNIPAEFITRWAHNKELVCKPAKHQFYKFIELKIHVGLRSPHNLFL